VRVLLPPSNCAALITSRWQFSLPGLKAIRLGLMSPDQAEAFLCELCPRIDQAVKEMARLCGYLPLALRIAGSFLAVNEDWKVPEYIERLQRHRLPTLKSSDDPAEDLEAAFDLSYQALTETSGRTGGRWQFSRYPAICLPLQLSGKWKNRPRTPCFPACIDTAYWNTIQSPTGIFCTTFWQNLPGRAWVQKGKPLPAASMRSIICRFLRMQMTCI